MKVVANKKDSKNPQIKAFLFFGGSSCDSSSCGPFPLIGLAPGFQTPPRAKATVRSDLAADLPFLGLSFCQLGSATARHKKKPSNGEIRAADIQVTTFCFRMVVLLG